MTKAVLEFRCHGMEVGYFEGPHFPTAPGQYRYEPYRSLGHYEMGLRLEQAGKAECHFLGDEPMRFTVVGCPTYGVLSLAEFQEGGPPASSVTEEPLVFREMHEAAESEPEEPVRKRPEEQ